MAAPVFETVANLGGGDSASVAVAMPAGIQSGDIILVGIYKESAAAVTPETGFTEKTPVAVVTGGQFHNQHWFWKRAGGSESGTYTFPWTGSCWREAFAMRISGAIATGDPFDNYQTATQPVSGNAFPIPASFTPSVDECLLIWSGTNWAGGAYTPPSGFTLRSADGGDIGAATLAQTTATATGSLTASYTGAAAATSAIAGAILPAGASTNYTQTPTDSAGLTDVVIDETGVNPVDVAGVTDSTFMPLVGDSLTWTVTVT